MDFEQQIKNLLDENREKQERVFGKAVLEVQRMVVSGTQGLPGTPRDTGQAASNWFVEADGTSGRTSDDTDTRNLGKAMAVVATALDGRKPPRYFSLFNNLPYIRHLEYGLYPNPPKNPTGKTVNGYSVQAQNGFFRLTCAKWGSIVKQVSKDET